MYCFYHFAPFDTANRWFAPINAFIHTIMYGYYALKAMEIKVPKQLAKQITTMQIIQMVIGVYVNVLSYYMKGKTFVFMIHSESTGYIIMLFTNTTRNTCFVQQMEKDAIEHTGACSWL